MNAIGSNLPIETAGVIVLVMAAKKQKRLNIHWAPEWDEQIVRKAKQLAIGESISFSAFVAEALRREVDRKGTLADKPKKK